MRYWIGIIFALAVGLASWSIYSLLDLASSDLFSFFGIENLYIQRGSIVLLVLIVLVISGYGIKGSIKKLVK